MQAQWELAVCPKRANHTLGCIKHCITGWSKEGIVVLDVVLV